jgi:Protein of unknown function (DUF2442)
MNPEVKSVEPLENYRLKLHFTNGDLKIFDVSPYLDKGFFKELQDASYFKSVRVVSGAVQWPHEQDFSNDTLYIRSSPLKT